jgi:hypothetical protein
MGTYLGWTVITIPTAPAAPAAIEVELVDSVALGMNPFTFQQQVQDWQASRQDLSITLPPLNHADAQAWFTFLKTLKGVKNVFQFGSAVCAAYPNELMGGSPVAALYFRLKANSRKYTIDQDRYYRIQFEIMQAF